MEGNKVCVGRFHLLIYCDGAGDEMSQPNSSNNIKEANNEDFDDIDQL